MVQEECRRTCTAMTAMTTAGPSRDEMSYSGRPKARLYVIPLSSGRRSDGEMSIGRGNVSKHKRRRSSWLIRSVSEFSRIELGLPTLNYPEMLH